MTAKTHPPTTLQQLKLGLGKLCRLLDKERLKVVNMFACFLIKHRRRLQAQISIWNTLTCSKTTLFITGTYPNDKSERQSFKKGKEGRRRTCQLSKSWQVFKDLGKLIDHMVDKLRQNSCLEWSKLSMQFEVGSEEQKQGKHNWDWNEK